MHRKARHLVRPFFRFRKIVVPAALAVAAMIPPRAAFVCWQRAFGFWSVATPNPLTNLEIDVDILLDAGVRELWVGVVAGLA